MNTFLIVVAAIVVGQSIYKLLEYKILSYLYTKKLEQFMAQKESLLEEIKSSMGCLDEEEFCYANENTTKKKRQSKH